LQVNGIIVFILGIQEDGGWKKKDEGKEGADIFFHV
jgi:hypothetical protein